MAGNYEPQRDWTIMPRKREGQKLRIQQINETGTHMNKLTDTKKKMVMELSTPNCN